MESSFGGNETGACLLSIWVKKNCWFGNWDGNSYLLQALAAVLISVTTAATEKEMQKTHSYLILPSNSGYPQNFIERRK